LELLLLVLLFLDRNYFSCENYIADETIRQIQIRTFGQRAAGVTDSRWMVSTELPDDQKQKRFLCLICLPLALVSGGRGLSV
jgi:hypothetical protein